MNLNIWRIGGIALVAGLALFLISLLVKVVLVVLATALVVRAVGGRFMGRSFGPVGRMGGPATDIISIDNPAYRTPVNRLGFDRVIPIG